MSMKKIAAHIMVAGFLAHTQAISWAADTNDVLDLSLEQLLAVNVVGASKYEQKQSEVAAAVSIITRKEIKTYGWRTLDEALASLPGIYTTYDYQYRYLGNRGIGFPGDFNTRVLVLINGNRFNDPIYDNGPFGRQFPLDMDLIDRIEFIPGPGGAVYGQNAMFGVVNVITRTGATVDGVEFSAAFQDPEAKRDGRASWGKLFDNGVDLLLSVSGMRSKGEDLFFEFPGSSVSSGVATGLDGARDTTAFGRIARGAWSLEHVYGDFRKDDPTGVYLSDPLVPGQYERDVYGLTQLQYQDKFADETLHLLGRLFMGQYRYRSQLIYGTPVSFPTNGDWSGMELRLLSTALNGHKLMIGIEGQDNKRVEQDIIDFANPANNVVVSVTGYRIGLYAQDEWSISKTLSSTIGVRVDRNDTTGTKWSPRAALIWQVAPPTIIKALYGRAHRAPNSFEHDYNDNVAQVNNPVLQGETANTMELVVDHVAGKDLSLRGSLYQWTMQKLVTLGVDPVSGLTQYQNGPSIKAHGVELSADKTWDGGTRLRGSLSYQNAYYAAAGDLPNSPHLMSKLNFSSPLPVAGSRLGYELQYYSGRQTINGTKLSGYWLSNLNLVADKWVRGLELSLGIYNLFDKRYEEPAAAVNWQQALVQRGRNMRFKVDYSF